MELKKSNIKLKGHESFYLREGWLRKGIKSIESNSNLFSLNESTDLLGVGSNMVKSIKYWLLAMDLIKEKKIHGGRKEFVINEDLGYLINKYDPYFEDRFTLWILHYNLCKNFKSASSWYMFFNRFKLSTFTKSDLFVGLESEFTKLCGEGSFSSKSLMDDCSCILKSYYTDNDEDFNPEINFVCPLGELNLIDKKVKNGESYYTKIKPSKEKLDKLAILYVILDNSIKHNTNIEDILNNECNVGSIFNLDRNLLNEYLDELEKSQYISVNRTAGLNTIYIDKSLSLNKILNMYYSDNL